MMADTVESTIFVLLKNLVSSRVYPDIGPDNAIAPYVTYQQISGRSINFLDNTELPSLRNSRWQINVWADTRQQAVDIAHQAETLLRGSAALKTTVLSETSAIYDAPTKLFGTYQDFSFWYSY